MVGMATEDLLGPDQLLARGKNLSRRGNDDPRGDACGDQRVENRIAGQADEETGADRCQGDVDIPYVVDVGEPDCRIRRPGASSSRATPQLVAAAKRPTTIAIPPA